MMTSAQLLLALTLVAAVYAAPSNVIVDKLSNVEVQHHISKRDVTEHQTLFTTEPCPGPSRLDESQKGFVLNYHNIARTRVTSTNMNKLSWDDELACQAQRVADTCRWGHDGIRKFLDDPFDIGQNIIAGIWDDSYTYMGYTDLLYYMDHFYNETLNYNHPDPACLNNKQCNHYKMMMMYKQTKMGAACSYCDAIWENNGGQTDYSVKPTRVIFCVFDFEYPLKAVNGQHLYTEGTQCSECEFEYAKCENDLCVKCEASDPSPPCHNANNCEDVSDPGTCTVVAMYGLCGSPFGANCQATCGAC